MFQRETIQGQVQENKGEQYEVGIDSVKERHKMNISTGRESKEERERRNGTK